LVFGRLVAGSLIAAALSAVAILQADGADDAIGRLMHTQGSSAEEGPAKNLPVAPAKPVPQPGAGPSNRARGCGSCIAILISSALISSQKLNQKGRD